MNDSEEKSEGVKEIPRDNPEIPVEITDPEKIKEALSGFVNKLCIVLADHEGFSQPGILLTDGKGFGFNGGIGFMPEFVDKIYPIVADLEKNEVRAVIYLKRP